MGNTSISKTPDGVLDIIRAVDRGEGILDLEEACVDVVDAVRATGKAGKVTVEMTFNYDSNTDAMRVGMAVKKSMPQKKRKESLFFITPEGNLTRMDHRQRDMFIEGKEVNNV